MTKEKRSFLERLTGSTEQSTPPLQKTPVYTHKEPENSSPMETSINTNIMQMPNNTPSDWSDQVSENSAGQLTIDMYQTDDAIVIKSTIAGVKPEDLDIAINNDMITITGSRSMEDEVSSDNYYYQECYWGSFSRSVVLPVDVLSEKTEAALKNGILTVRLPKADTNKTKRIQVRGF